MSATCGADDRRTGRDPRDVSVTVLLEASTLDGVPDVASRGLKAVGLPFHEFALG